MPNVKVRSLAVCGTNLYAGTDGDGVFLSINNGSDWSAASTGLTNPYVYSLAVSGRNLFAGTCMGNGVFLSTDNGATWTQVSTGLTTNDVSALAISGSYLFAGTEAGVWRRPLSDLVSVKLSSSGEPAEFSVDQNYPNPFNPSTTIKYELPEATLVNLRVYDILGREVSVLVNEKRDAGVHEVKFDGSNLASGVYFYRLQAGDFVQSKRLLILK